ncbi:hypothetical protein HH214_17570 [Mucilaginibacter robiniae]|uniref:Streptomycin biosynthesis protein StrF domain-containing protein n=1 Tax=Mucilaginibacter robiniae TaxID=2728022 RepID=A0A7L5E9K5_9SPHI|nr:glycosyltransferase [Mucilaginibacter robiniae]QJD97553.1 hypothetical protein HH214_17570 [Mucilaginibacter robiniae]
MISVIICSVSKSLREQILININETIGVEHEVIIIENEVYKYPIAKAYNIGAQKAKYPYLCFSHEDIKFHTQAWGKVLINDFLSSGARLIGVLGCAAKVNNPSSVHLANSGLNRQNHLQRQRDNSVSLVYENPYKETLAEVCTLDGMFIAATKSAWAETKFSEDYLHGFHGYDIDFSIKNFVLGKVVVTYNLLLEHFSFGSFNKGWVDTQRIITEKWKDKLPLLAPKVSQEQEDKAETLNLKDLIAILIDTDYNPLIQLKYIWRHFKRTPFEKVNLYYLRRVILRNKLNNALKNIAKTNHKNDLTVQ